MALDLVVLVRLGGAALFLGVGLFAALARPRRRANVALGVAFAASGLLVVASQGDSLLPAGTDLTGVVVLLAVSAFVATAASGWAAIEWGRRLPAAPRRIWKGACALVAFAAAVGVVLVV